MNTFTWIVVAVFALLTLAFILEKVRHKGPRSRGVVKMLTSLLFVVMGAYALLRGAKPLSWLVMCGLFFAFLGDLFLVFMDNRTTFILGVVSFSCASLSFAIYGVIVYGFFVWAVVAFVLFVALIAFLQSKKIINFGTMPISLNVYTVFVGLCGLFGLFVAFNSSGIAQTLFGLGCFAYFVSDVALGLYLFKLKYTWVDVLNSVLYFPGIMLVALSLLL